MGSLNKAILAMDDTRHYKNILISAIVDKCKGHRQKDIAALLGLSQPRVSKLVNQCLDASFSLESLITYAKILDIPVKMTIGDNNA